MYHPTDKVAHTTTVFLTPVVKPWLEWKEGNVLFNDVLITFYGYMASDIL